jgi:hypothetical protein
MKFVKNIVRPVRLFVPGLLFLVMMQTLLSQTYPIVFVSRNLVQGGSIYYPQAGLMPGMGPFSRTAVVGGRLLVREANGTVRVLVDSTMNFSGRTIIDVSDPCPYWNASKIVFAGIEHRDSSWRIYEIKADGTGFKKITNSNRNINLSQFGPIASKFIKYDDIDPCYFFAVWRGSQDNKSIYNRLNITEPSPHYNRTQRGRRAFNRSCNRNYRLQQVVDEYRSSFFCYSKRYYKGFSACDNK